jgi:hypothetical protein
MCERQETHNPFEIIEIDIKYIDIHGFRQNAYLNTIFYTFTRTALCWEPDLMMELNKVIKLTDKLTIELYLFILKLMFYKIKYFF